MYRPPARQPKGKWALFLHRQRRRRGWSQLRAFLELREGLGMGPKSRGSYQAIDMGTREPRAAEAEFLIQFFGIGPDDEPEEEPIDPLNAVPALLKELRAEREALRLSYEERQEWDRAFLGAILEIARAVQRQTEPPDGSGNAD